MDQLGSLSRISRDGQRILAISDKNTAAGKPRGCLFTLENLKVELEEAARLDVDKGPPLPNWNLYRVIASIAPYYNGVAFCGRSGKWRGLALDDNGTLRISALPSTVNVLPGVAIQEQARKTSHGCTLQTAEFSGGSKVFLDSRGLMHFKSSDPALPEVSIVMADGEVAGWTSDGYVCGPSFFFDGPHVSDPKSIFDRLMNFCRRI
jgi:hypothetical protein